MVKHKEGGRIVVETTASVIDEVEVEVDVTDEVNKEAERMAGDGLRKDVIRRMQTGEFAHLDINAAILAVSRLAKREVAAPAAILAALLKEIGSDALTREVRAAQRAWK